MALWWYSQSVAVKKEEMEWLLDVSSCKQHPIGWVTPAVLLQPKDATLCQPDALLRVWVSSCERTGAWKGATLAGPILVRVTFTWSSIQLHDNQAETSKTQVSSDQEFHQADLICTGISIKVLLIHQRDVLGAAIELPFLH